MKLSTNREILKAREVYYSVFSDRSPYREPFHEDTPARALIYPVDTYPDDDLYYAIANAADNFNEGDAYFSTIMNATEDSYFAVDYWKLDLLDYPFHDKGMKENGWLAVLESTLYSTKGRWGLILTDRQFGIIGGSNPFLDALREWVPDLDQQVQNFLDHSEFGKAGIAEGEVWLPPLLNHVYGVEKTDIMLG